MGRLQNKFDDLTGNKGRALIAFITAGDPSLDATRKYIAALERGGVDIVELGIPFSDPMADGPVIQAASERALKRGATLKRVISLVREARKKSEIPILLMGYYNPILAYGLRRYAEDAARAGVDATLVVDLPPEESTPLDRELKRVGICLVYLLAPTSNRERIKLVAGKGRGFIYFVSMTGITGANIKGVSEIRKKVIEIKKETSLPVAIGFGIRDVAQARRISKMADGVVIGSAFVKKIGEGASPHKIEQMAKMFKRAIE